jgi:hypothetical protein
MTQLVQSEPNQILAVAANQIHWFAEILDKHMRLLLLDMGTPSR